MRDRGRSSAGMKVGSRGWCPHVLQETTIVSPLTKKKNIRNKVSLAGDSVIWVSLNEQRLHLSLINLEWC